ncbi:MAG: carboxypeptidase-like regulatory domain-containing protein [Flavobacteriales bacterium]
MRHISLLLLFLLQGLFSTAQDGTITGTVQAVEGSTLQPQPFANVAIKGTSASANTDIEGHFSLKIPAGTHTLVASLVGLTNVEQEVTVLAGTTVRVKLQFEEGGQTMEALEVVRERKVDSEAAVMMAVRQSEQVANGVGREQIAKGQDRTAADVVKRIPGITLVNDRFIMIRGLADRYNMVLLNGVAAPSMEPDKRSFSFDLLPSGGLDRVMVYKTGSPELPGEFAGGVVDITTSGVPEKNEVKVSIGAGILNGTTFRTFEQGQQSATDLLGHDDGSRSLPSSFPTHLNSVTDPAQLTTLGREMANTWTASSSVATPDQRLGLMLAYRLGRKNGKNTYGNTTLVNWSNTYGSKAVKNFNYNSYDPEAQRSDTIYRYNDLEYGHNARLGVMHNWTAFIGTRTKIEFRNLFNQLGENQTTLRTGQNLEEGNDVRNFSYRYRERTLYSGQLIGRHQLANDRTAIEWTLGLGIANGKEPDFRRVRSARAIGDAESSFQVVIAPSASTLDAGRFFSTVKERTATGNVDATHRLTKEQATFSASVRTGILAEQKEREFAARWMSFKKANSGQFNNSLTQLPLDQVFSEANINSTTGFQLVEGTNPSDNYTAANSLLVGYLGTTLSYAERISISGGVRLENNRQQLRSATYGGVPVVVDRKLTSVLPSINASYKTGERSLVRMAWSATVNRPEFRELAPFAFYDFSFNNVLYGNPALRTATIQNMDARMEFYPGTSEVMSLGVFRKTFIDPIEMFFVPGAGSGGTRNFTYKNAESAESLGAEVEVRRSLKGIFKTGYLSRWGVLLNASVIHSTVTLGKQAVGQQNERPMMGQSPYVLNAGLYYSNAESKIQYNIVYNTFGKRLYAVGSFGTPDIYEMPIGLLDVTLSKVFGEHLEIKLGINNLLEAQTLLKQDSNEDGRISDTDELIMSYRQGAYFSGGVSYTF